MADSSPELHLEIETLERKHAENPEGRFFVPLANAYRKLGDLETAEALLRSGVERHPDYLSAHIVLGRCLADRGDLKEAEEEFRYVLSRDPQNLIALRTLGELAAGDGRPDEASEWYRELLGVDPMNEEARQALNTLGSATKSAAAPAAADGGAGEDWWKETSSTSADQDEEREPSALGGPIDPAPEVEEVAGEDTAIESEAEATIVWSDDAVGFERERSDVEEDPDEDGAFTVSAPAVVTETIAELYTRQGLHDRAAGVYRELIRRRGGDAALEARLADVERLARGESAPEAEGELVLADEEALLTPPLDAPAEEEGEPADDPTVDNPWNRGREEAGDDDPFAASVAAGLSELQLDRDEDHAGEQDIAGELSGAERVEDGAAATIAELLRSIARWRPASGESEADLLDSTSDPAPGEALGMLEEAVAEDTAAILDDLSFLTPADEEGPASGTAPADDEPFPWEISGTEGDPIAPAAQQDSWASAAEPVEPVEPTSEWREEPAEERSAEAAASAEPQEGADRPAPATQADDEDLESFQAWLRSLKR